MDSKASTWAFSLWLFSFGKCLWEKVLASAVWGCLQQQWSAVLSLSHVQQRGSQVQARPLGLDRTVNTGVTLGAWPSGPHPRSAPLPATGELQKGNTGHALR